MELSLAALSQYTTPVLPKDNPWIDKAKKTPTSSNPPSPTPPAVEVPKVLPNDTPQDLLTAEPPVKSRKKRRPPTRRIMRHVLRARVEAVKALAGFFDQLERGGSGKRLHASAHLAKLHGWEADGQGWRTANEVTRYLRSKGAKIPSIQTSVSAIDAEWAALSSDGEVSSPVDESSAHEF